MHRNVHVGHEMRITARQYIYFSPLPLSQPCFDMFYNHVKEVFSSDATLTVLQKCALIESLVLISNEFKDFEKQKAFIDELLASVMADWTSDAMKQ